VLPPNVSKGVEHTSGITIQKQAGLHVYPNPADGIITFDYNLDNQTNATLRVTDITGKLVMDVALENTKGEKSINTSSMSNGIYYYQLLSGGSAESNGKFVVSH